MAHTSDKLRKRFEAVWYTIPGIIPPEYKEEMWDLLETAIKDRESEEKRKWSAMGVIVRSMLGYSDKDSEWFPLKQEGDGNFCWRKRFRERIEESGLDFLLHTDTNSENK